MNGENKLPELLAPAGDRRAFEAAVEFGADAVYLGGRILNARMNAANFDDESLAAAVRDAHLYGARVYVTVNTLCRDRELAEALDYCAFLYAAGVDAVIMADLGLASLCREQLPSLELHASTQACGHGVIEAEFFARAGFSRMVLSRELPLFDIAAVSAASPIETELFIHGAQCVSVSGQCLCSFAMGGRSGNRGECAQPCRKQYNLNDGGAGYPLSLRDMCLAGHITDILSTGVSSLKIEGRMKSAEYVGGVVKIYRRLLDSRRNANAAELDELASLFSRGGFTDGYFTGRVTREMTGVRSDDDKAKSRGIPPFEGLKRRVPLALKAVIKRGEPVTLTLCARGECASVEGEVPLEAINAPSTVESAAKNLCRFGGTAFEAAETDITVDSGVMVPAGRLNSLRRDAVDALTAKISPLFMRKTVCCTPRKASGGVKKTRIAEFNRPDQITRAALGNFDITALPLWRFDANSGANAVIIPPVFFAHEENEVRQLLEKAAERVKYALVSNAAHIALAKAFGLEVIGGLRLNVNNAESAAVLTEAGCEIITASPELSARAAVGLCECTYAAAVTVYGRLPLMYLTRCVISDATGCKLYGKTGAPLDRTACITDTTGAKMPLFCSFGHRNELYNSVPVYAADRMDAVDGLSEDFIFTDESAAEVDRIIAAYKNKTPPSGLIRRLK